MTKDLFWSAFDSSISDLKNYIQSIEIENEQLKKENDYLRLRYKRFLEIQAISALLTPSHTAENIEILCHRIGISITAQNLFLICFFNKNFSNKGRPSDQPFDDAEMDQNVNLIRLVLSKIFRVVVAPHGDTILVICMLPDNSGDIAKYRPVLLDCFHQIAQARKDAKQILFYVAVSPVIPDVHNLYRAYDAIKTQIDYKSIMEDYAEDVLFAEDITNWPPKLENYIDISNFDQFSYLVSMGNFCEAKIEAAKIIDKCILSHPAIQTLNSNLSATKDYFAHTLGKACRELSLSNYYDRSRIAAKIIVADTVHELKQNIAQILEELGDAFLAENPKISLPQRIRTYIDKNFVNPDINVNLVADYFNITPTHATQIFRTNFQCSILNYIHLRRITMAKENLGRGYSIREIAEMTGYQTSANLIRAFKRVEGVTPGQFEKNDESQVKTVE